MRATSHVSQDRQVRSSSGTVHEYIRIVEAYREDGEVKQRVVADLGRKRGWAGAARPHSTAA